MTKIIKFISVDEDQLEKVLNIVPLLALDEDTIVVPYDCIDELTIVDEDGDRVFDFGLIGKVIEL